MAPIFFSKTFVDRVWYSKNILSLLLLPISWIYIIIIKIRSALYQVGVIPVSKINVPIIVVGNITAGGTGKTPLVIWLANYFKNNGGKMTYRTYIRVVEKLKIIFSIVFLMTMLYLASQGDRRNYSPTYLQQQAVFQAELEKRINDDEKRRVSNKPRGKRLDGVTSSKSIKELMEGFRGFL